MNNSHSISLALHQMLEDAMKEYHAAHEQIAKHGAVLFGVKGEHIVSPYIQVGNRYVERIIALSKELGLTPKK